MTLPDLDQLKYEGGIFADPLKVTDLARVLQNGNSGAAAASLLVKSSPGLLFGFTVSSTAAQFIQVFDASALPADGAVPVLSLAVGAASQIGVAWIPPRGFRGGIVLCNSSTQHTKTIGSATCIFDVQFL